MSISRRSFVAGAAGMAALSASRQAIAVTADNARSHVERTVAEIRKILTGGGSVSAPALRKIMARQANMPLIAQFCAGRSWRDMNAGQRKGYVDAFGHYISVTYARRFSDFAGTPTITIGRTIDAGRKGMLVESPIQMPDGKRYAVEWLVSDRGGAVEIVDLVIERVSMAATQRDEIGAMLDKRSGNVDALIQALRETK